MVAMRALITNDDGIGATGLRVLARAAVAAGLDVTVAAPDSERSGSGAAISALEPGGRLLVTHQALDGLDGVPAFAVRATPALIAFVASGGVFGSVPDIVLSGINHGPNLGQAVLHSGTVGAALTAASHGIPALAVSLASAAPAHWDAAGPAVTRLLAWFAASAKQPVVTNVNLPDRPAGQLRGFRAARLAVFGAVQAQVRAPGAGPISGSVPVTFARPAGEPAPDSDLALLGQGWATITVLRGLCEVDDALDLSGLG
jgi:5'-nucleotidase